MATRTQVHLTACTLAICLLLAGCGQRGPLTLPEEALETETQSEENTQDDEQEDE